MGLMKYGEYENLKDVYIRERELIDLHKPLLNGHLPSKIDINYSDNPKEYKQNGTKITFKIIQMNTKKNKEKMNQERNIKQNGNNKIKKKLIIKINN